MVCYSRLASDHQQSPYPCYCMLLSLSFKLDTPTCNSHECFTIRVGWLPRCAICEPISHTTLCGNISHSKMLSHIARHAQIRRSSNSYS